MSSSIIQYKTCWPLLRYERSHAMEIKFMLQVYHLEKMSINVRCITRPRNNIQGHCAQYYLNMKKMDVKAFV